jgi:two-component system sensor histidine kinase KdpD
VLTVGVATGAAALMQPYFEQVDLVMVFLLGVMFVASRTSTWPALFAAFLSVASFDFFFVPPYYTFAVSDIRYLVTFVVMFLVSIVISRLTLRVRSQAESARMRERRTAALYRLSRDLVREREVDRLSGIAAKHIGEVFDCQVAVFVPGEAGRLAPAGGKGSAAFAPDPQELSVAQWVYEHRQAAGLGSDTLPGAKALYLPLVASAGTVGVIGILPRTGADGFEPEQIHYLETFANQTATAIERSSLGEAAQRALLTAETESLRNTLLSSISHDLRTPLSAITGAATTLLENDLALDTTARLDLLQTIQEEAEHLNRIIKNVLDMTRLESGAIKVNKEWQSLEEIVGVALNRLGDRLQDHPLAVTLPGNLPLLPFDGLLIEQVLMNLFDNAIKYTPKGTPLELSASEEFYTVTVELADRGPGIPPGEEERIFEKFVRGRGTGGGVGLGLAICRTIMTAHGGRIWAENREGGGAVFRFTLSSAGIPPLPAREEEREN